MKKILIFIYFILFQLVCFAEEEKQGRLTLTISDFPISPADLDVSLKSIKDDYYKLKASGKLSGEKNLDLDQLNHETILLIKHAQNHIHIVTSQPEKIESTNPSTQEKVVKYKDYSDYVKAKSYVAYYDLLEQLNEKIELFQQLFSEDIKLIDGQYNNLWPRDESLPEMLKGVERELILGH